MGASSTTTDDPITTIREFLTWAVGDVVESGELAPSTPLKPLIDMLAAMVWGMTFYGGFVGTERQVRAITAQIKNLLTGRL